jgi:hypothetical protein
VIPEEDYKPLYDAGVVAIFGECVHKERQFVFGISQIGEMPAIH